MESVTYKIENGLMTVCINGRMDSSNTEEIEGKIKEIRQETHDSIVLDLENLEYTSSAGLRVILRMRKEEPTLKIINANSEVYEIFNMTGFSEMMPIEKAYRRISVEGCEVIGQGANGKVYRLDADTIIKVYLNPDSLPDIQRERELARCAFVKGIPTAIPYDVVRVGDGYGSVFELLNAKSYVKLINEEPDKIDYYIGLYIDFLKKIHATEVKPEDMPDMKAVVLDWVEFLKDYLPEKTWSKLYSLVNEVPVCHNMLHGDYHFKNIMMQNGETLLIDMDTLCQGHPIFELASMYNAYVGFGLYNPGNTLDFLGIEHEKAVYIWRKSLELYVGDKNADEIEKKAKLIGLTRLMRRGIRRNITATEQGKQEIEMFKENIIKLADEVDTLLF